MKVLVNGAPTALDEAGEGATLAVLIDQLGLAGRRIAVEVNADLVPRGRFAEHRLAEGDRIEIIHAVGGG